MRPWIPDHWVVDFDDLMQTEAHAMIEEGFDQWVYDTINVVEESILKMME